MFSNIDGKQEVVYDPFQRVFETNDIEAAAKIAESMIGEEVYYREVLHSLLCVEETQEECSVSWDSPEMWMLIYKRLRNVGLEVQTVKEKGKVVGLRIKEQ